MTYSWLDPQWAQVIVGVVALLLTALLGIIQLRIQNKNNIDALQEGTRKTLKLDVYKEVAATLSRFTTANGAVTGYVANIPIALRLWLQQHATNPALQPTIVSRCMEFQRLHFEYCNSLIEVLTLIEQYLGKL